jgi:D-glycero-D-manno-heptose 1,7-bisphosphate phosphatase
MTKLLLVDCDGTIRKPASRAKFISRPTDQKIIYGADKAVSSYYDQGFTIIGVTNQGGVEKGYKTLQNTIDEQVYTLRLLPQIKYIFFCPDYAGMLLYKVWLKSDGYDFEVFNRQDFIDLKTNELVYDSFRKPGSGMLKIAIDSLGDYPEEVLFVGDSPEDEAAAVGAAVDFIWASVWRQQFL